MDPLARRPRGVLHVDESRLACRAGRGESNTPKAATSLWLAAAPLVAEPLPVHASFADRAAVITGASSGIGWALAKTLAKERCRVGLIARRRPLLDELAGEIRSAGGVAAVAEADVGDREQVRRATAEL